MAPVAWMVGMSALVWAAVTAVTGAHPEVLFGMLGPLASASAAWVVMTRVHAAAPARLMGVMIKAFAVKMVFFAAYVVAILRVVQVRPVPFVLAFTAYFISLHMMEALFLKRLLAGDLGSARPQRT
jgi:hypothetical protein